jgi:hypothetical protein
MAQLLVTLVVPVVLAGVVVGVPERVAQLLLPGKVTLAVLEQITSAAFMVAVAVAVLEVLVLEVLRVTVVQHLLAHCLGLLFITLAVAVAEHKTAILRHTVLVAEQALLHKKVALATKIEAVVAVFQIMEFQILVAVAVLAEPITVYMDITTAATAAAAS